MVLLGSLVCQPLQLGNWFYLFVVITTIFTINFLRSPIGRSTLSVREDEIAAESVGINTTKVKVIAFVFGAITTAIAGSLQAGFIGSVVRKITLSPIPLMS